MNITATSYALKSVLISIYIQSCKKILTLNLQASRISGNSGTLGSAIVLQNGSSLLLDSTLLADNTGISGGALLVRHLRGLG